MSTTSKLSAAGSSNSQQELLERVIDALTDEKMSGEQILALADECFDAGLKKQRDKLVAHAALAKKHLRAAFLYASEQVQAQNFDFLLKHCAAPEQANPCCLILLAQMMEDEECSLAFDANVAARLLTRAIDRAKFLALYEDCAHADEWRLAALRATYEYVRYILDYKVDAAQFASWEAAQNAFAHLADDAELSVVAGVTSEDMLDIVTLRGRIADAAGRRSEALEHYRRALPLARSTRQPLQFLLARVATLTPDDKEARRLLPAAVKWLDDEGVGKNDAEMPDLLQRYADVCQASMAARAARIAGSTPIASLSVAAAETMVATKVHDNPNPAAASTGAADITTATATAVSTAAPSAAKLAALAAAAAVILPRQDNVAASPPVQERGAMTDSDWRLLAPLSGAFSLQTSTGVACDDVAGSGEKRKFSVDDGGADSAKKRAAIRE